MSGQWRTVEARLDLIEGLLSVSGRGAAEECGVDRSTWSLAKRENRISGKTALKIQARTQCNLEWLLTGNGDHGLRDRPPLRTPPDEVTSPKLHPPSSSHIKSAKKK